MLREFCAENMTHVPAAIAAGAGRIELCDNLAVGGTTPSAGVIEAAASYAHARGVRVMAMIRPRGGDFVYAAGELASMETDAGIACELGADGIVLSCLKPCDEAAYRRARVAAIRAGALPGAGPVPYRGGYRLDLDAVGRLAGYAAEMGAEVVFHMAFDELDRAAQLEAVDQLPAHGVTRILTHGGPAGTPIDGNLPWLRELVARAAGRVAILPGGGISHRNAEAVARELGVDEVHGTHVVDLAAAVPAREG